MIGEECVDEMKNERLKWLGEMDDFNKNAQNDEKFLVQNYLECNLSIVKLYHLILKIANNFSLRSFFQIVIKELHK